MIYQPEFIWVISWYFFLWILLSLIWNNTEVYVPLLSLYCPYITPWHILLSNYLVLTLLWFNMMSYHCEASPLIFAAPILLSWYSSTDASLVMDLHGSPLLLTWFLCLAGCYSPFMPRLLVVWILLSNYVLVIPVLKI